MNEQVLRLDSEQDVANSPGAVETALTTPTARESLRTRIALFFIRRLERWLPEGPDVNTLDPFIKEMLYHQKGDGTWEIKCTLAEQFKSTAEAMAWAFVEAKGTNYVQFDLNSRVSSIGPLILTIQRRYGKSPAELKNEADARANAAIEEVARLKARLARRKLPTREAVPTALESKRTDTPTVESLEVTTQDCNDQKREQE